MDEIIGVETIPWYHIEKAEDTVKGRSKKVHTHRFSPKLSSEEQARREMAGKKNYQKCARLIWESARTQKNIEAAAAFGLLDNDTDVEEVLCTYQGNLVVIYITLWKRPCAFKHIDTSSLEGLVNKQDKSNYTELDDDKCNLPNDKDSQSI